MTGRIIHFSIVLGVVCAVAALGVAKTYDLTQKRIRDRVAQNKKHLSPKEPAVARGNRKEQRREDE